MKRLLPLLILAACDARPARTMPWPAVTDARTGKLRRIAGLFEKWERVVRENPGLPDEPDPGRGIGATKWHRELEGLFREFGAPDPESQRLVVLEATRRFAPATYERFMESERRGFESAARMHLRILRTAQEQFRIQVGQYWQADVSGLRRARAQGFPHGVELIARDLARADGRPCVPLDREGSFESIELAALGAAKPLLGYWYVAIAHPRGYAIAAYPEEYGRTGRLTFYLADSAMWAKDLGGRAPEVAPENPASEGWEAAR